ncbi:hypothetical protein FDZ74_12650 [bacterium]|nr:MAG: hypothetical protein FDZ74_12650 [bacterium]
MIALLLTLSACGTAQIAPTATSTPLPPSATLTDTPAPTASVTPSATITRTPTITLTPTITETPTITPSPTFDLPDVVVNTQAHCRYGPSKAYLHAADLYPGDTGVVWGRFAYSAWLWIKLDKINYACWAAPSVLDVTGDINTIRYTTPDLMKVGSNQYGPPHNVAATRDGNQVTITWDRMVMTEDKDRGYFIEAWVCQNGAYLWWTVSFPDQYTTTYTVQDDSGCKEPSKGEIRTVEKHGFSEPVPIPWP